MWRCTEAVVGALGWIGVTSVISIAGTVIGLLSQVCCIIQGSMESRILSLRYKCRMRFKKSILSSNNLIISYSQPAEASIS